MTFQEASAALMREGVTLREIADAFGAAHNTARAWRLTPDSEHRRGPPLHWPQVLGRLARQRGKRLEGLAEEIEQTQHA